MTDLIVDPEIRTWVFLPIVILTFMAGVLRHYLTLLLRSDKQPELEEIRDGQTLLRSQLLRANGTYLTESAFQMRKNAFIKDNLHRTKEEHQPVPNIYAITEDKAAIRNTVVMNALNYLPMFLIGGWLMYMLSGFLLTKVPIPLTLRFKHMLQKDIYLDNLDAEWVSSASWYFLNVCGLRSFYYMFLGDNYCMEQTMDCNYAMAMAANTPAFFKNEIEALVIHKHECLVDQYIDTIC